MKQKHNCSLFSKMKTMSVVLHLLCLFVLGCANEGSTIINHDDESCFISAVNVVNTTRFPSEVIPLTRSMFHEVLDTSIMVVAFYGDDSTPGWLATKNELKSLAQQVNETFSKNTSRTVARIVIASLAEKTAPRLYRQYAQTTNNKEKVFIYMFLPETPDIPLKISWYPNGGDASTFAVVKELESLDYRLELFDNFREKFEYSVLNKMSLKPLIIKTKALIEETQIPENALRGMKYLRILQNVETKGLAWIATQLDAHKVALSAGRCGFKAQCIKGWKNQQLLKHFAVNVIDDAYAEAETKETGKITKLHRKYDLPTPLELLNKTSNELALLSNSLEIRKADLQNVFEDKGDDVVDLMEQMANVEPAVTRQRLRETYLLVQRDQLEKISGKYFMQYGEMVHQYLFTKKIQVRINHLIDRAVVKERGERALNRITTKVTKVGPLM
jgi:hypothetical protein